MRQLSVSKVYFQSCAVLMASYLDDWGEDDVVLASIAKQDYNEVDAMNWWLAMCNSAPPRSSMLDVGSYTGLYSLMTSALRSDVRTIAFEASTVTYGRLSHNVLLNLAEMRIIPAHYAISDQAGTLDLGHAFGIFTMASGESVKAEYQVDHKETVLAESLDRLLCIGGEPGVGTLGSSSHGLDLNAPVHGMKIDTEGAEEQVLLGAKGVLSKHKPHLIIEIFGSDVLARIAAMLADLGYQMIAQCAGCNYVFCHSNKSGALVAHHKGVTAQCNGAFRLERLFTVNVTGLQH